MVETYLIQASWIENFNNLRNLDNRQHQQKVLLEYLLPAHVNNIKYLHFMKTLYYSLDKRKVHGRKRKN